MYAAIREAGMCGSEPWGVELRKEKAASRDAAFWFSREKLDACGLVAADGIAD
jgi:hypothetical protein